MKLAHNRIIHRLVKGSRSEAKRGLTNAGITFMVTQDQIEARLLSIYTCAIVELVRPAAKIFIEKEDVKMCKSKQTAVPS